MKPIREKLGPQILFDFSDILEAIEFVSNSGYNVLEINLSNPFFHVQLKERRIRKRIREKTKQGMKLLFHYPEGVSFFTVEEEFVNLSLSLLKKTIANLNEIAAERLTLHLGNDFTFALTGKKLLTFEVYPDFYRQRIEKIVRAMRQIAQGETVLCIENVGGFRYPFVMEILSRHLGENLGLTLDIGHINRLPPEKQKIEKAFFHKNRLHIKNCHIHDNSGEWDEHNIVGEGKIDIRSYLEMLSDTETYLIVEVRPKESALESLRRLEKML